MFLIYHHYTAQYPCLLISQLLSTPYIKKKYLDGSFIGKNIGRQDSDKVDEYKECIDVLEVNGVVEKLCQIDTRALTQQHGHDLVNDTSDIRLKPVVHVLGLYKPAVHVLCVYNPRSLPKYRKNQKDSTFWFNKECWEKRKAFRRVKRRHKNYRSLNSKDDLKTKKRSMNM